MNSKTPQNEELDVTTTPIDSDDGIGATSSKYKPEYCQLIVDFFNIKPYTTETVTYHSKTGKSERTRTETKILPNEPKLMVDFEMHIGVCKDTLRNWCERFPEFRRAYARARDLIARHVAVNAMSGVYNPTFSQFALKNLADWQDKTQTDTRISGDVNVTIQNTFPDPAENEGKQVDKRKLKSRECSPKSDADETCTGEQGS